VIEWRGLTYTQASRILYELRDGQCTFTPRTNLGSGGGVDVDDDGIVEVILQEVALPCRVVGPLPSSTALNRRFAGGGQEATLRVELETLSTFTEIPGFSTPSSIVFRLQATEEDRITASYDGPASGSIVGYFVTDLSDDSVIEQQYQEDFDFSNFPFQSGPYDVEMQIGTADLSGIEAVTLDGQDKQTNPTLASLPPLGNLPDLEEVEIRRLGLLGDIDGTSWPSPLSSLSFTELEGGGIVFSDLPEAEKLNVVACSVEGSLDNDLFDQNGTIKRLRLRSTGGVPDQVVDNIPDQLTGYIFRGSSDTAALDLSQFGAEHDLTEFGNIARVGDAFSAPSLQSRDISGLMSLPDLEYVESISSSGEAEKVTGDLSLKSDLVRLPVRGEALTGYPTDFSVCADTLSLLQLQNAPGEIVGGTPPAQLPGTVSASTSTNDVQASVSGAWSDRAVINADATIIWQEEVSENGTSEQGDSYTKVLASSLDQEGIRQIIGTGIGTQFEKDGLIDYFDARHPAVLDIGAALTEADASNQTITLDLSTLPIDPPYRLQSFPDPTALPSEEDFRDICFASGTEFRLRATGSVDGVYISAGATLNGSVLTVNIDSARELPATDAALTGECWVQYA
jgi:hypothetical protein